MILKDALDGLLQTQLGLNRRVAQVEARLELSGKHIRGPGPGIEVGNLEWRWLEVLGAFVPDAAGQLRQRGRERMYRVLSEMRIGAVTLHAMNGQSAAEGAASAYLDRVADRLLARRLTDDAVVDALLASRQGLHDALGTLDGPAILITGGQESDRALVVRVGCNKRLSRRHHGREATLHFSCSAAVELAIADARNERVVFPLFQGSRRDDIGVACNTEDRTAPTAHGPEVLDTPVT